MIVFLEGGLGDQVVRVAHSLIVAQRRAVTRPICFFSILASQYNSSLPLQNQGIRALDLGELALRHRGLSGTDTANTLLLRVTRWVLVRTIVALRAVLAVLDPRGRFVSRLDIGQKFDEGIPDLTREKLLELGFPPSLRPSQPGTSYHRLSERAAEAKILGVHLRLSDYRGSSHMQSADYYRTAVREILDKSVCDEVWLFSEEPASAEEMLGSDLIDLNVSGQEKLSVAEDLSLLAQCHSLVLSASHFSTLAALFNAGRGTIISPARTKTTGRS